jgi:hypothetical protein
VTARAFIAIAIAGALGCGGHGGEGVGAGAASGAPPDVAALWALAPAGADAGVVVSGRAMALAEGAMVRLEALGQASPAIAQAVDAFERALGPGLASGKLARWSDVGFSSNGGLAFFHLPGGRTLAVVTVADRDKFVAATKARKDADGDHFGRVVCRTIAARYQCVSDPALFDAPRAEPDGHRAATLHGDIEAWVAKGALPAGPSVEWTGDLAIAATISPGTLTVRAHLPVHGAAIARAATKPVAAPGADHAAGVITGDLSPLLASLPPSASGPVADALRALAGPITVVAPPGAIDPDLRAALRDAAPMKALLAACDQVVPPGAGVTATPSGDGCHVALAVSGIPIELDAWIDGTTLRARRDRKAPPAASVDAAPTALGKELGDGTWTWAVWGRGTIIHNLVPPGAPPSAAIYAAPFFALSELGIGVRVGDGGIDVLAGARTIWDDPEDVIAAIAPVVAKALGGDEITGDVKAIAAKFPQSPYAADVRAGEGGLMLPVFATGLLSAIIAPLYVDYQRAAPPP